MLVNGTAWQWVLVGLVVVVCIPIVEEILYRGVLFGFIRRQGSTTGAIWISSVVFGIAHLDVSNSIGTGVLGLALAYMRVHTGSIYPAILTHMAFNAFGFTIMVNSV